MEECSYCKFAKGLKPCHKIWEDDEFLAFLSIFPCTEGFSIVIPKEHHSCYAFDLPDEKLSNLILAAKKVALLLDSRLEDVKRCALIVEGFGVDHVHVKLFPMHGTSTISKWEGEIAHVNKYFIKYEGYVSSHEYVRADDNFLEKLARKIRKN